MVQIQVKVSNKCWSTRMSTPVFHEQKGIYKYLMQWNHECKNLKRRERALGRSWGRPNLIIWYKDGEGKNFFDKGFKELFSIRQKDKMGSSHPQELLEFHKV
jgi:hypothetical protein